MLAGRLQTIFDYVEPTHLNDGAFGHEIRQLLMAASTEVESGWKAVLEEQAATPRDGRYFTRRDYVRLAGPMQLDAWGVEMTTNRQYSGGVIRPFLGWGGPGSPLPWYDAYNAVKHDREDELQQATLKSAITAVAAAFVMTVAQFGEVTFDSQEHFPAEEFVVVLRPFWSAEDSYIQPAAFDELPAEWTPVRHPL